MEDRNPKHFTRVKSRRWAGLAPEGCGESLLALSGLGAVFLALFGSLPLPSSSEPNVQCQVSACRISSSPFTLTPFAPSHNDLIVMSLAHQDAQNSLKS